MMERAEVLKMFGLPSVESYVIDTASNGVDGRLYIRFSAHGEQPILMDRGQAEKLATCLEKADPDMAREFKAASVEVARAHQ